MQFPPSTDDGYSQAKIGRCRRGHLFVRDARSRCRECDKIRCIKNRTRIKANRREHRRNRLEVHLLQGARRRARAGGYACTITLADIVIPEFCPLLGVKLQPGKNFKCPTSPSLDKMKPELGYVPGNVWVVSYRANTLKNDASLAELQMLVAGLVHVLS